MNPASTPKPSAKTLNNADWRVILRRKPLLIITLALLVAAGAWGVWRFLMHPPRPFVVRWQISRYLKKHDNNASLKVDFPFPSKSDASKGKSGGSELLLGTRTGKEFEVLAREYIDLKGSILKMENAVGDNASDLADFQSRLESEQKLLADAQQSGVANDIAAHEQQVRALQARVDAFQRRATNNTELQRKKDDVTPILADLIDFQKAWETGWQAPDDIVTRQLARARTQFIADMQAKLRNASSYSTMYQLIGQELYVAERLLDSPNADHSRMGLSLAMQASYNAIDYAQNGWLAARICEGYVWPHLELATDVNRRSTFNLENVLSQCERVFQQNGEANSLIRNSEMLLANAHSPLLADTARAQLGRLYAQQGEPKEALSYYKQIKNTNDASLRNVTREISRLEQQLKTKSK
jgi:hypothetical protein